MRWKVDHAIERVGRVQPLGLELDTSLSEELVELWVEDVCWQVRLVGWSLRRPPWWRRQDRREWRRARETLDTTGVRLRARARAAQGSDAGQHRSSKDHD